jgi:hydrogenase nickel incorporation protein HypB
MHGPTTEHILERLLEENEDLAQHNREHFTESGALALNLMSAPGAGKTTLLAETIKDLTKRSLNSVVIEGDMVGELDAARLRELGITAFQISTGRSCHLDAQMVAQLLHKEILPATEFVFIENVGNLVCPAEFPLGEHLRIVLLSVTEGDDKPFKYPVIFHNCDAVILTKCDLLPYVSFDSTRARQFVRDLNPRTRFFEVSARTGQGLQEWCDWLEHTLAERKACLVERRHG